MTGYLIYSPWRTHQSFDLFFPATIDSTRDIRYNLQHAKPDTGTQVSNDGSFWDLLESGIPDTIRNEALDSSIADYLEYCIVFPVVATLNTKMTELFNKDFSNELGSWPVKFYGNELFTLYNRRPGIYMNIRIIKLPKQSG